VQKQLHKQFHNTQESARNLNIEREKDTKEVKHKRKESDRSKRFINKRKIDEYSSPKKRS